MWTKSWIVLHLKRIIIIINKTLTITILQVRNVPNFGYEHVYSIECHCGMMIITYEVTIGVIPNYTYPNFVFVITTFEKKGKFIFWKHLYFIYKIKMFCDHKIDGFINQHILNINEIKKLLQSECIVWWLNIGRNYTPHKSIQNSSKWFQWTWLLLLKFLSF